MTIEESLNLPDLYITYSLLADIVRNRGDEAAAAQWQAKYEAKVAELERLRRGEGEGEPGGQREEAQLAEIMLALAQAAFQARTSNSPLEPEAAEILAQINGLPPPLGGVGAILQAVAAGQPIPPVPSGLPPAIAEIIDKLVKAVEEQV